MGRRKAIFLTGLPKAGKSLISWGLYKALLSEGRAFFLERLAPDMEGQWTLESPNGDSLARFYKNRVKEAGLFFSPAFVRFKAQALLGLARGPFEVVIGDLGGLPSPENRAILQPTLEYARGTGQIEVYPVVLYRVDLDQDPTTWQRWWAEEFGVYPLLWPTAWSQVEGEIREAALKEAASLLRWLGI